MSREKIKNFTFGFDIFENFQGMCFILSDKAIILDSNKSAAENLKRSNDELEGTDFLEIFEESQRNIIAEVFRNCLTDKKSVNVPTQIIVQNSSLSFNLVFTPFCDQDDPSTWYSFALARDITAQKKVEEDFVKFFAVAENTVNPLQITNLEGKMVYVNKAFVEASGYSKEELLGNNPNIFSSGKHPKRFWEKMWDTINSGKVWVGEVENKKKGGKALLYTTFNFPYSEL